MVSQPNTTKMGTCTIIVASNQPQEYDFIPYTINLNNIDNLSIDRYE